MVLSSTDCRLRVVKECRTLLRHLPLSSPVKQLRLQVLLLSTVTALLSDRSLSCNNISCEEILLRVQEPSASDLFYNNLLQALNRFKKALFEAETNVGFPMLLSEADAPNLPYSVPNDEPVDMPQPFHESA